MKQKKSTLLGGAFEESVSQSDYCDPRDFKGARVPKKVKRFIRGRYSELLLILTLPLFLFFVFVFRCFLTDCVSRDVLESNR